MAISSYDPSERFRGKGAETSVSIGMGSSSVSPWLDGYCWDIIGIDFEDYHGGKLITQSGKNRDNLLDFISVNGELEMCGFA